MAGPRLLDWLFPPRCQVCGRLDPAPLCAACRAALPAVWAHRCLRCGQFLDPLARTDTCADCRSRKRHVLDVARAATPYAGSARDLVCRLKYRRHRRAAAALGLILADWLATDAEARGALMLDDAVALVPVPLHRVRRLWRGFNQAELLADELAALTSLPVRPLLRRIRHTRPQVGLDVERRRRNVSGAFAPYMAVETGYYILVDDVYTSGATLRECAGVLRKAGAKRVGAITVTRRLDHDGVARVGDDSRGA